MGKVRLILILSFLCLGVAAFAADPPKPVPTLSEACRAYGALSPAQMLEIRPDFLARHTDEYSIELAEAPIRNQCKYGGCWAYQAVSFVERRMQNANGRAYDLSEAYLILRDLQAKSLSALEGPGREIVQGSHLSSSLDLIAAHGAVPQSSWQPRVSFEDAGHGTRLVGLLNERVVRFHYDSIGKTSEEKAALKAEASKDLDSIVEAYSGPMPTSFEEGGVRYESPQDYWRRNGTSLDNLRRVVPTRDPLPPELKPAAEKNAPKHAKPEVTASAGVQLPARAGAISKPVEAIAKDIVGALKRGESVPVSFEMDHRFIDEKTGIMSLKAFSTPEGLRPIPYAYRRQFGQTGGNHAMEIVGVEIQNGEVIRFKVRNTWGENSGDEGYYHVYADYFREYLIRATLPVDP